jgi:propionyl-CoA carboxylase alpha chain
MNTRLHVEHPATEEITGHDLDEQMIRVAAGEKLPFKQKDIGINGWSIESRVYAEDPYRGFLPSIGRLVRYAPPSPSGEGPGVGAVANKPRPQTPAPEGAGAYVRVDDGVAEGGEVSMFYDPMIAKLVTWGPTREAATLLQVAALDRFEIEGPGHNVEFLSALMQHPRFRSGELTTGFIAEEYPDGFHGAPADEDLLRALAAITAGMEHTLEARANRTSGQLNGPPTVSPDWVVRLGAFEFTVTLGDGHALVDQHRVEGTCDWQPGRRTATASGNGRAIGLIVRRERGGWRLTTQGATHRVQVLRPRVAELAGHMLEKVPPDLSRLLLSPMPGLLVSLAVKAGDKVEPGQPLATVEAMKMENILRAQKAGTVKSVSAEPGQSLAADAVILELE